MSTPRVPLGRAVEFSQLPLPGNYPCITMQMNVTYHPGQGLGKFVAVLREPSEQIELARTFHELDGWASIPTVAIAAARKLLAEMDYLGGGRGLIG